MFSTTSKAALIACLALTILTAALVAAPAAATQQADTPPNTTTTTTTPEDDSRNVTIQVDDQTYVADYDYRNGKFRVTLTTSAAVRRVTISEAIGGDDAGTGYFSVRQVTLQRGEPTTVEVPAEMVDGKAVVSLTTRQCISSGKCPYIQQGSGESTFFDGAAQWNLVYLAGFIGMTGTAWGTYRYMTSKENKTGEKLVEEGLK
jgi:biopolymer transport protein ExbD